MLEDGSILTYNVYGNPMIRVLDGNADGSFLDHGETYVTYDQTFASWNGLPTIMANAMTASTK